MRRHAKDNTWGFGMVHHRESNDNFFFFMDVNPVVCEEILNAIVWDNDLSTHSKELDLNQQR